jgi:gas vesicle protein
MVRQPVPGGETVGFMGLRICSVVNTPRRAGGRNLFSLGEITMDRHSQENHSPGFLFGLLTGAALGAGLVMYCAPKIGSEIRKRVAASAKDLGDTASEYYEEASSRVGDAVEDLTSSGQTAREAAADLVARGAHKVARGAQKVARGAHEVERFADQTAKAAGNY